MIKSPFETMSDCIIFELVLYSFELKSTNYQYEEIKKYVYYKHESHVGKNHTSNQT